MDEVDHARSAAQAVKEDRALKAQGPVRWGSGPLGKAPAGDFGPSAFDKGRFGDPDPAKDNHGGSTMYRDSWNRDGIWVTPEYAFKHVKIDGKDQEVQVGTRHTMEVKDAEGRPVKIVETNTFGTKPGHTLTIDGKPIDRGIVEVPIGNSGKALQFVDGQYKQIVDVKAAEDLPICWLPPAATDHAAPPEKGAAIGVPSVKLDDLPEYPGTHLT